MALATEQSQQDTLFDSLPYIDAPLTEAETQAANALIAASLPHASTLRNPHPSLTPFKEPTFSPLISAELTRLSSIHNDAFHTVTLQESRASKTEPGFDASRYEPSKLPPSTLEELRVELDKLAVQATYLRGRDENLNLLSSFGANAWMMGNDSLENILRDLESQLKSVRDETNRVNGERKRSQEERRAELDGLEEAWKRGVGRVLETEIATLGLRRR